MKVRYLVKMLLLEINRTLGRFLVTTVMLGISFALLLFEASMYLDYIYRIVENQWVLSVDDAKLYIINMEYYKIFWSGEETRQLFDFIQGLNEGQEGICAGLYYTASLNSDTEVLCISRELIPIGKLADVDGNPVDFSDKQSVAVGYGLREQYPIGTIILDEASGREYQVNQILRKNSAWLANNASNGLQTSIELDDRILMDANAHLEANGYVNILNGANNNYLYHPAMSKEAVNAYVQEQAERMGIRTYETVSLQEKSRDLLYYAYKSDWVELLFVLVCLGLSMTAQYLSVVMNLKYRRYMFGVLLSCKWTGKDLQRMSFLECSLRLILGFGIAIPCSYAAVGRVLGGTAVQTFYWILPVLVLVLGFFHMGYYHLIGRKLRAYQIRELLGGEAWK